MQRLNVDGLDFDFLDDWQVGKFDEWVFYRNQFSRMRNGIKSIDLLVVCPAQTSWFIEVKDYRDHQRTKPTDLADEVAQKVFDTLAALLPAKLHSTEAEEQALAQVALEASRIRVVLHLEQPAKHSKLRPRAINPADVKQKLSKLLKPIDAHPIVSEKARMGSLQWDVT
ncbi:hypothetical protein [Methylophilus sp. OH31]|uniref:hypothetical protein n=1 Tax=Methylophilus sp. OH31 TaxID=1387312 RepID=UPI000463A4D8|nr:hypothetical protein [Methylophilus sp. OH31]